VARVVITPSADADTSEIIAHLEAMAGYAVAARYSGSFEQLYDNLAHFPDAGAPRPGLGANMRVGVVSPYVVIYRHDEGAGVVRVLRIVHGSRKITGKLLRGAW
jgi:toxin ParE1/3/4